MSSKLEARYVSPLLQKPVNEADPAVARGAEDAGLVEIAAPAPGPILAVHAMTVRDSGGIHSRPVTDAGSSADEPDNGSKQPGRAPDSPPAREEPAAGTESPDDASVQEQAEQEQPAAVANEIPADADLSGETPAEADEAAAELQQQHEATPVEDSVDAALDGDDPAAGEKLKHIVEAALLAAGKPLSIDRLLTLFLDEEQPDRQQIRHALETLQQEYSGRGIEVREVSTGWRIQVTQNCAPWISRLWEEKPGRYSRALLETLALIAYRQPVTRGEIEDVRGVAVSTNIIKTLLEREWVRVVGHRDVPGRPSLYATTREFLDYFGLKGLDELPTLAEIRELDDLNPSLDLDEPAEEQTSGNVATGEAAVTGAGAGSVQVDAGVVSTGEEDAAEREPDPGVSSSMTETAVDATREQKQ